MSFGLMQISDIKQFKKWNELNQRFEIMTRINIIIV